MFHTSSLTPCCIRNYSCNNASLYYKTGDFKTAHRYFDKADIKYKTLSDPHDLNDIRIFALSIQEALRLIPQWEKRQFLCEPKEINVTVPIERQEESFARRLYISSFCPVLLKVTSDNPAVKAMSTNNQWTADDEYQAGLKFSQEIIISIQPVRRSCDVTLMVTSEDLPAFKLRVPLHIIIQQR